VYDLISIFAQLFAQIQYLASEVTFLRSSSQAATCSCLSERHLVKGRVQYFLMLVIINKCFLLNPVKKLAQIRFVAFEKNAHFNSEK